MAPQPQGDAADRPVDPSSPRESTIAFSTCARTHRLAVASIALLILPTLACAHRSRVANDGNEQALRVMTYNIESGRGALDGTVDAIRASAPDIAALQEVDVHWADRSGFADQAAMLGERLGMEVRFARIYEIANADPTRPARQFGVALLSRFRVVTWRNDTITRLSTQEPNPLPAPMPGLLEARLDIRGAEIRVFNTHLDYRADPGVRRQQVADMLRYIGESNVPTLVLGDLNASPTASEVAPLFERLADAWPSSAGPGLTYPADKPEKRIDYVLVSPHFRVRSATVPPTEASDHRPVVVDLVLR